MRSIAASIRCSCTCRIDTGRRAENLWESGEAVTSHSRPDLDECRCGDFRRDHEANGVCRICGTHSVRELRCTSFRFFRHAPPDEIARQESLERYLEDSRARWMNSCGEFDAGDIPMEAT